MRLFYKSSFTIFILLCMAVGHQTTALSEETEFRITDVNEIDAFVKSEENYKNTLIFSHLLPPSVKTVVLDAGHGGKDRGCKGHSPSTKEKEIALAITLKLGEYIESYFPDVKVIYTRKEDVFVTLNRRARIANENKADLFISIHCNYIRHRPDVFGSETYVMGLHTADHNLNVAMRENAAITMEADFKKGYDGYDPNSAESHIMLSMFQNAFLERSILFAELVENQIPKISKGRHSSRGVRQAGFLVLKETAMPSVLVETGYLSHQKDEAYLITKDGQKDMAFAIFKAFSIYKNIIENDDEGTPAVVSIAAADRSDENTVKANTALVEKVENDIPETKKAIKKESHEAKLPAIPVHKVSSDEVEYMIQLAATPVAIDLPNSAFASLIDNIIIKEKDGLMKYLVPVGRDKAAASSALKEFKSNGHPKAFLSVYKGNERIKILYN